MRKILPYLILFAISSLLVGCGGSPAGNDSIIVEEFGEGELVEGGVGGVVGEVTATGLGSDGSTDTTDLPQAADLLAQRVVYFEYDSSILTAEGEAVVQAHASYLNGVTNIQLILEGHADERGTREYNLALAEDRARSVANVMHALGVGEGRIQTVSYGEERPVTLGHDESTWSLNRRVEILYQ